MGGRTLTHRVAVLPGDGIGPEVTAAAVRVLHAALPACTVTEAPVGATAIASHGKPLPDETLHAARTSDAILFGAVGGPGFDDVPPAQRPESALLALRKTFGLYANVRPARAFAGLEHRSPLRPELVTGMDCVIVRELTGGLYFGPKTIERDDLGVHATETLTYHDFEIERIARFAFDLARTRRKHVTSVDKSNVLVSSQLWRRIVNEVARDYPDVTVVHMLVDNAAMQLVRDPRAFDVLVTENMFGDILSDLAAAMTGGLGLAPSASLSDGGPGIFEPVHGSAPDIAGRGAANPTAMLRSTALLLEHGLGRPDEAAALMCAIEAAIHSAPTSDLGGNASTSEFGSAVRAQLRIDDPAFASYRGSDGSRA